MAAIGRQPTRKAARSSTVIEPWLKRGPRGSIAFGACLGASRWAITVIICEKPDRDSRNSQISPSPRQDAGPPRANRGHMNTERVTSPGLQALQRAELLGSGAADVATQRERSRQSRLAKVAVVVVGLAVVLWWRQLTGNPVVLGPPMLSPKLLAMVPSFMLVGLIGVAVLIPFIGAGRSPHVLYRPSEIDVSLDDVKGAGVVVEEATRKLNLFLAHKTFRDAMGGTPRRGVLFEGPPGTGKTYMARAMAREAGVPFLFVSSSAFQSMYYGQTNRKIRSYFKALRNAARKEGGAIGFIEEIDAIGAARTGMGSSSRERVTGVVNELLIQLQSFDTPPLGARLRNWGIDVVNTLLPDTMQLRK